MLREFKLSIIMDASVPIRSLSELLADLKNGLAGNTVTLDALIEALHERGIAMLLLLFAAPMALPLPVPPGINVMLATPLLILTAQQALGAHTVWMPDKIRRRSFAVGKLQGVLAGLIPWMKRLELIVRPRLGWLTQDGPSRFFGLLGFFMALSVCVPLPLTNTVPSLGIALMAIGYIMRDGVAVLAGAFIGTAWILMLATSVIVFGPEAFEIVKTAIKTFLGI